MNKKNLIIGILALVALIGLILALLMDKDTQIIIPTLALLIGYLIRANEIKAITLGSKLIKRKK